MKNLLPAFVFAWVLFPLGPVGAAEVSFEMLEFKGGAEHGVFAEDLDGDGVPDLLALGRGRISVYRGQKAGERQYPDTPEVLMTGALGYFATVAKVLPAPGKQILILTPTGVDAFVQENGRFLPQPREVLRCDTLLTSQPLRGAVGRAALLFSVPVLPWNFAFDADGDGRDDLLVPHGGGTDIYLQTAPGQFAKPLTLPIFPIVLHHVPNEPKAHDLSAPKTGPMNLTLSLRPIERRDVNGDQKLDLVCGAQWFAQKHTGGFDPTPAEVPDDVAPAPDPDRAMVEIRRDINGDGRLDLVRPFNDLIEPLHIVTYVRYWLADAQGTLLEKPTGTIRGQNILIHSPLPVLDFVGDGTLGFAMFDTDIRLTEIAKWIRQSFGNIDGDLNFWFFDKATNAYPARRSYHKTLSLRFKVDLMDAMAGYVWERYLGTMMRFEGDFNGDKRPDLLAREETNRIALYFNTGDPRALYPDKPNVNLQSVPAFGGLAIDDLNGDGASDLIIYRGSFDFSPTPNPFDVIAIYISRVQ
jgi:hypothetical protein